MTQRMNSTEIDLSGTQVLIVEDQPSTIDILRQALEPEGYRVLVATSGEVALKLAPRALPDLILMDVMMAGMDGFQTCRQLKQDASTASIPVIFLTAKGDTESVVQGFQSGGADFVQKPFQVEEVLARVTHHVRTRKLFDMYLAANRQLAEANNELKEEIGKREQADQARRQAEDALREADEQISVITQQEAEHWGIAGFVARSKAMKQITEDIRRLQHNNTTNVLVTGESGTGKELIARAIHFGGTRSKHPFIPVNCSAIPPDLAESLFFGHARGAFTGANTDKKGYFELAQGGTLFLDEVGDMPFPLQAKLLRVLEDGRFIPVGADHEKWVNVRVISATNANFEQKIETGSFRSDLYFRLAGFAIHVPPLRERPEDIPVLALHLVKRLADEMGIEPPVLSSEALEALSSHPFSGNVRELKNILERALIESGGAKINADHLHISVNLASVAQSSTQDRLIQDAIAGHIGYADAMDEFQKELVERVLKACDGNRHEAARRLSMHRPNLVRMIRRLGVDDSD